MTWFAPERSESRGGWKGEVEGAFEVGAFEIGTLDARAFEVGIEQFGAPKGRSSQVGSLEDRGHEVGLVQIRPEQHSLSEIAVREAGTAQVGAGEIGVHEGGVVHHPAELQSPEGGTHELDTLEVVRAQVSAVFEVDPFRSVSVRWTLIPATSVGICMSSESVAMTVLDVSRMWVAQRWPRLEEITV